MWESGCAAVDIAAAETRLGVAISAGAAAVLQTCEGAGFPSPASPSCSAAEICLAPVRFWSKLNEEILALDVLGDLTDSADQLIMIGDNPWGADYTVVLLLHAGTDRAYSLMLNTAEIRCLGPFETWVSELRFDRRQLRDCPNEPEEIAERHREYLEIEGYLNNHAERLARWETIEKQFVEAVRQLRS